MSQPQQYPHGKKKKGRAPAHQNKFAFRHNPKSKKTDKILLSPNVGVCNRCYDMIEWRKKYRKYKPRTQPGTCNKCRKRNVLAAYHTICKNCSWVTEPKTRKENPEGEGTEEVEEKRYRVCAICAKNKISKDDDDGSGELEKLIASAGKLSLRERKTLERKFYNDKEKAKDKAKKERRALRDLEGGGEGEGDDDEDEDDNGEGSDGEDGDANSIGSEDLDAESVGEEDDPFLQAVGGKDKLLTGEAYQKMLLEKEKE